jgi:hypothetical protein
MFFTYFVIDACDDPAVFKHETESLSHTKFNLLKQKSFRVECINRSGVNRTGWIVGSTA